MSAEACGRRLRWSLLSALSGVLSGLAAAAFLLLLEWATHAREAHRGMIWFLPWAGLATGWAYHRFGKGSGEGSNLILEEIHDPKKVLPLRMAPLVLFSTVLTHLFGGSAGREGTAVQMGATLSDQLTRFFRVEPEERKILLVAGVGAGFGAAIGAPLAGAVFGMEVVAIGRLRFFAWLECLIASFVGYYAAIFAGVRHSAFPVFVAGGVELKSLFFVALAGVVFGCSAAVFVRAVHLVEGLLRKAFPCAPPLRLFAAGALLAVLYRFEGSYRYAGLGIPEIQAAMRQQGPFSLPALKTVFTALTVGSGFKGGEFVPLVFIGATLGSALSLVLPVSFHLLASVGFAAVFAGAANTPIACSLMAAELFGWRIIPYAAIACFVSYYCSGDRGIYKTQRMRRSRAPELPH